MLTHLKVRNFKAFRDSTIEFSPITILLGKNSVGKSSLLQILTILKQTAIQLNDDYPSPLKLNGRLANAGEPKNLFHFGNADKPLGLEIGFATNRFRESVENELKSMLNAIGRYSSAFFELVSGSRRQFVDESRLADSLVYESKFSEKMFDDAKKLLLQMRMVGEKELDSTRYRRLERLLGPYQGRRTDVKRPHLGFFRSQNQQFLAALDLLKAANAGSDKLALAFQLCIDGKGQLTYDSVAFKTAKGEILRGEVAEGLFAVQKSDFFDASDWPNVSPNRNVLQEVLNPARSLFNIVNEPGQDSPDVLSQVTSGVLGEFVKLLRDEFSLSNFNHVPPLRAKPKRYYFSEELAEQSVPSTVVDTLISNSEVGPRILSWVQRLEVSLAPVSEKEIYFRLLVEGVGSLDLDVTDVGFGVSQVLPVITYCFLTKPGGFLLMEQPEVHLHPSMQSALAELFDEATLCSKSDSGGTEKRDKTLLVETHSEYLLQKIAHLLSVGRSSNGQDGLVPSEVSVNYVVREENNLGSRIEKITPPQSGPFVLPDDFADRQLEILFESLN